MIASKNDLYNLAYKYKIGWSSNNSQNYILRLARFYFEAVFDLRMCDKVLRDGLDYLYRLGQHMESQVKLLLKAQEEFTAKTSTLIDHAEETKNKT